MTTLLLAACVARAPFEPPDGSSAPSPTGTGTPTEPTSVVPTESETWSLAAGWSLWDGSSVDDLTGDGVPDLVLELRGDDLASAYQWVIVAGPASAPFTLPDDAWAWLPPWEGVSGVLEATGDGVADLVTWERVIAGPLPPGELSGGSPLAPFETVLDVTGDGIGDRVLDHDSVLRVWSGPEPTAAAASVVVDPACDVDGGQPLLGSVLPDVTGDGWAELHLPGTLGYDRCGGWLLSASPGTTDPTMAPDVVQDMGFWQTITVVGDQNGDGLRDLWLEGSGEILYGPLSFAGGQLSAAGSAALPPPLDAYAVRVPADLDGDGMGEFLTAELEPDAAVLTIHLGGPNLTSGAPPYGKWRYEAAYPRWFTFVDSGRLYLALTSVEAGHGATLVDVGAAEWLAPTD